MLTTRVIPCLLLRNRGLVKTVGFSDPTYVGDPINAVKIFNEKEVDELAILDIEAPRRKRGPDFEPLEAIAAEAFMPMAYGGGLRSIDDIRRIFKLGFEKAVLNSVVFHQPDRVREAADRFGSQSVVVSIDVRKSLFGRYEVFVDAASQGTGMTPEAYAERAESLGAGELILNSADRDGTMKGYDIPLLSKVSRAVGIPVVALGGAGRIADLAAAVREGGASAAAAGSLFVFRGRHRAVLITYPPRSEIERAMSPP